MKLLKVELRDFFLIQNLSIQFDPIKNLHVGFGNNEAGKSTLLKSLKWLIAESISPSDKQRLLDSPDFYLEALIQHNQTYKSIIKTKDSLSKRSSHFLVSKELKTVLTPIMFLNQESIIMGSKDLLENIQSFELSLYSSIQGSIEVQKLLKKIDKETEVLFKPRGIKPELNRKIAEFNQLQQEYHALFVHPDQVFRLENELKLLKEKKQSLKGFIGELEVKQRKISCFINLYPHIEKIQNSDFSAEVYKQQLETYSKLENSIQNLHKLDQKINSLKEVKEMDPGLTQSIKDEFDWLNKNENHVTNLVEDFSQYQNYKSHKQELILDLQESNSKIKVLNQDLQGVMERSLSVSSWKVLKSKLQKIINDIRESKIKLSFIELDRQQKLSSFTFCKNESINVLKNEQEALNTLSLQISLIDNKQFTVSQIKAQQELAASTVESSKLFNSSVLKSNFRQLSNERESLNQLQKQAAIRLSIITKLDQEKSDLNSKLNQINNVNFEEFLNKKKSYLNAQLKLQEKKKVMKSCIESGDLLKISKAFQKLESLIESVESYYHYFEEHPDLLTQSQTFKLLESKIKEIHLQKGKYIVEIKQDCISFLKSCNLENCFVGFDQDPELDFDLFFGELKQIVSYHSFASIHDSITNLKHIFPEELALTYDTLMLAELQKSLSSLNEQKLEEIQRYEQSQLVLSQLEKDLNDCDQKIKAQQEFVSKLELKLNVLAEQHGFTQSFSETIWDELCVKLDDFFTLSESIKQISQQINQLSLFIAEYDKKSLMILGHKLSNQHDFADLKEKINSIHSKYNELKLASVKIKSNSVIEKQLLSDRELVTDEIKAYCKSLNLTFNNLIAADLFENKKQIQSKLESIQNVQKYMDLLNVSSVDDLVNLVLSSGSLDQLKSQQNQLSHQLLSTDKEIMELEQNIGSYQYQLSELQNFSAKEQYELKIQSALYELKELSKEYLVLQTTKKSLQSGLKQYQNKYQSKLINFTSHYFKKLTLERYKSVSLDFSDPKGSCIYCTNQNGVEFTVDQLSEGTRDQLFLSLKLGFIKIYLEKHAIPLVLDDVLVNFDDARTVKLLEIIEEFSQKTQIFLTTHHHHVVELCKKYLNQDKVSYFNLDQASKELAV